MSKIIYNFGTMNSSKTAQLLMVKYNYESNGKNTLLLTPSLDSRSGIDTVSSRIGLEAQADYVIGDDFNNYRLASVWSGNQKPAIIFVDECQFLTKEQVNIIENFARKQNISVHAFGLLKDFQNNLFDGSKRWLEVSDNLTEIKNTCAMPNCERKATRNVRFIDGTPVFNGDVVQVGDEEYKPVCANHYIILKESTYA